MSLYGNQDNATGNNKPKYANTSSVMGVSATEAANTQGDGQKITHAGWVQQTLGTGPVASIAILAANTAASGNGFITFSGGGGSGANASFTVDANNLVNSVTLLNGGSGYTSVPTASIANSTTTFTVTTGGRSGRRFYETLVAGGSITGDNSADDTYFPGT